MMLQTGAYLAPRDRMLSLQAAMFKTETILLLKYSFHSIFRELRVIVNIVFEKVCFVPLILEVAHQHLGCYISFHWVPCFGVVLKISVMFPRTKAAMNILLA